MHESESDPLERLERREHSARRAFRFTGITIAATFITALVVGIIGAVVGGPNCDAGISSFICSRFFELAFPIIPAIVALAGTFTNFWITYKKWKHFGNWRPWLAMCWVLMPFSLMWMVSTFGIAMLGLEYN